MAHYVVPDLGRDHIDACVDRWKAECLLRDGSLFFDDRHVWTEGNLENFRHRLLDEPIVGTGESFMEKLAKQLVGASDDVRWLASELLVVYFLAVWWLALADSKITTIRSAAAPLEAAETPHWPEVEAAMHQGLLHPGGRFNFRRDTQLGYLVDFAQRWKQLSEPEQMATIENPWELRDFADSSNVGTPEMRHVLLHLLRPNEFEGISSKGHKAKIIETFKDRLTPDELSLPVDEQLLAIRESLEAANAQPDQAVLNFYEPPLYGQWRPEAGEQEPVPVPESPAEAHLLFFFTAASGVAANHYHETLEHGVAVDKVDLPASPDLDLAQFAVDDRLYVWGARPGSAAEGKWKRLQPGDIALVYHDGHFPRWGRVKATVRSAQVAEALWGTDGGTTWECMMFFEPTESISGSREYVVGQLGYKPTYYPQGLEIPGDDAQALIVKGFGSPEGFVKSLGSGSTSVPPALTSFDLSTLDEAVKLEKLELPAELLASVLAALISGKHIILTGAPGTAKTTLAHVVAKLAHAAGLASGFVPTTATADWTTYETIGGLRPTQEQTLAFAPGHFVEAIEKNHWLVIDELNRSNFDRAFGQLFTVLSGQAVVLPFIRDPASGPIALVPAGASVPAEKLDVIPVGPNWRIIATMNVFDKTLLFEMSYALMRRFAFIEVPSPEVHKFIALISKWSEGDQFAFDITVQLLGVREVKDVGPATYRDIARYVLRRRTIDSVSKGRLAYDAFYSFLLPQFEGIDDEQGRLLHQKVLAATGASLADELRAALNRVLDLQLTKVVGQQDQSVAGSEQVGLAEVEIDDAVAAPDQ